MNLKMSPMIDMIAPALVRTVNAIEPLTKDRQADRYRYADIASCLEEIRPILAANGLTVMQPLTVGPVSEIVSESGEVEREPRQSITTMILHESGQWISGEAIVDPEIIKSARMAGAQAVGSAITYLRRYSLFAMLSIATEDDDGQAASQRAPEPGGYRRDEPRRDAPPPRQGGGNPGAATGPPRTGRALFAWAKDQDEKLGVDLMRTLSEWGKTERYPSRMVDWDGKAAEAGYAEALRILKALKG